MPSPPQSVVHSPRSVFYTDRYQYSEKVDSNPSNNNRVLYLKDDVMFGRWDRKKHKTDLNIASFQYLNLAAIKKILCPNFLVAVSRGALCLAFMWLLNYKNTHTVQYCGWQERPLLAAGEMKHWSVTVSIKPFVSFRNKVPLDFYRVHNTLPTNCSKNTQHSFIRVNKSANLAFRYLSVNIWSERLARPG